MGHRPAISFGHTGLPPLLKPRRHSHSHQTHFRETSFAHSTWLLDSALATAQDQPGEALLSDLPSKASNTQPIKSKMESEVSAAAAKSTSDHPSFWVVFEDRMQAVKPRVIHCPPSSPHLLESLVAVHPSLSHHFSPAKKKRYASSVQLTHPIHTYQCSHSCPSKRSPLQLSHTIPTFTNPPPTNNLYSLCRLRVRLAETSRALGTIKAPQGTQIRHLHRREAHRRRRRQCRSHVRPRRRERHSVGQ